MDEQLYNKKNSDFISLKDFVKGTISEIASAIEELNADGKVLVNPYDRRTLDGKLPEEMVAGNLAPIKDVDFCVTIGAARKNDTGGNVDIKVFTANLGKQGTNETVNTIKFSLPVVFPFGRISDIYVDSKDSNP